MSEIFTLDTLQEFWASRPKGARIQLRTNLNSYDWEIVNNSVPIPSSCVDRWRWEPQSKPIDLSSLVGSDVLCDFGVGSARYGFLGEIIKGTGFVDQYEILWKQCSIVMDKWMAVSESVVIPDGLDYEWEVTGADHIKIVKFNKLKEGYCWSVEE